MAFANGNVIVTLEKVFVDNACLVSAEELVEAEGTRHERHTHDRVDRERRHNWPAEERQDMQVVGITNERIAEQAGDRSVLQLNQHKAVDPR